jgi:dCMP deaminase
MTGWSAAGRKVRDMMERVDWDTYFIRIAVDISTRSTCYRRAIGSVIVNDEHEIVSTGYNGNPRGMKHCAEIGCVREVEGIPSGERSEVCTAVHAEQNALIQAGRGSRGSTLYTTVMPCNTCAKMIVNAGIRRVVYQDDYPETMGINLLRELGVEVVRISSEESKSGVEGEVKGPGEG